MCVPHASSLSFVMQRPLSLNQHHPCVCASVAIGQCYSNRDHAFWLTLCINSRPQACLMCLRLWFDRPFPDALTFVRSLNLQVG